MTRVRLLALWAALLLATVIAPAVAHEGHDHDAPPAPRSTTSAPRAETASDTIELVVIARGGELELYIDDFRTNAPIDDAAVEVETPTGPAVAKPESGRPYRLAAPWALKPGRHDLVVTVMAGTILEVLPVTLTIPEPPPMPAQAASGIVSMAQAAVGAMQAHLPSSLSDLTRRGSSR